MCINGNYIFSKCDLSLSFLSGLFIVEPFCLIYLRKLKTGTASVPRPIGPPVVGGLVSLLHLRLVREGEFASFPHLCLEKKGTLVRKAQKAKGISHVCATVWLSQNLILIYSFSSVKDFSLEDCL